MSDTGETTGAASSAGTAHGDASEQRGGTSEPRSEADALLSRLRVIEDQPLESRAAAFTQLHDELQHRLEGGDSAAHHA